MRTIIRSLALCLLMAVFVSPALAAPDKDAELGPPPTVTGVIEKLHDGEIVLKLELTEEKRSQVLRLLPLENGHPQTPGRLGVLKGDIFARYMLAPDKKLEETMEKNVGRRVILQLDRALRVQGLVNGP